MRAAPPETRCRPFPLDAPHRLYFRTPPAGIAVARCPGVTLRSESEMELQDRWVHFRIADVFEPTPQQLLYELHGEDLLQGVVIGTSDSGQANGTFAIVHVEGIDRLLVVPLSRLQGVA